MNINMFKDTDTVLKKAIKYETITNYLKARIENNDWLDANEIKRILIALEVGIKEKEKKENE